MNNWTENELKEIKKIISAKANIKENENKYIVIKKNNITDYKQQNSLFSNELIYGIEALLNSNDKDEIDRLLKKHSKVEYDNNNVLHYGLIKALATIYIPEIENNRLKELITLSSISKDNLLLKKEELYYTQIFTILKELIGQYDRIINNVITKSLGKVTDPEIIKEKITEITVGESFEEKQANFLILKTLNSTNNLSDELFFNDIITKCNSKVKDALINRANILLAIASRDKEKTSLQDAKNHRGDFNEKFRKNIQGTVKKYNGGYFYGRN